MSCLQPCSRCVSEFTEACVQTPHVLPCFTHTLWLDDTRWVYNNYTSDRYFSDLSCNICRVYSLYQDFCIYKSGFLDFHSSNYLFSSPPAIPPITLHMSCMWMCYYLGVLAGVQAVSLVQWSRDSQYLQELLVLMKSWWRSGWWAKYTLKWKDREFVAPDSYLVLKS